MKQIISWLLTSSQNPENYSLFIKSAAALAVLFGLDSVVVQEAGGQITNIIIAVGMFASSVSGMYGLYRKMQLGRWSAPAYSED
jgi:hypothetical protein